MLTRTQLCSDILLMHINQCIFFVSSLAKENHNRRVQELILSRSRKPSKLAHYHYYQANPRPVYSFDSICSEALYLSTITFQTKLQPTTPTSPDLQTLTIHDYSLRHRHRSRGNSKHTDDLLHSLSVNVDTGTGNGGLFEKSKQTYCEWSNINYNPLGKINEMKIANECIGYAQCAMKEYEYIGSQYRRWCINLFADHLSYKDRLEVLRKGKMPCIDVKIERIDEETDIGNRNGWDC